ncbi:MAG: F0F1 ATP synthase subunit B [Gemmatimonadota bacterium]
MNLILAALQHGAEATEAAHAESPNVFALAGNVSFWTVVIFLLLLIILAKFAFPPILGYAAAREQRIQDALDAARRDREEAQKQLEEQRQALVKAREEGTQLISDAQKAAERVRRDLLEKARVEQEELLARAKAEIESERARAIDSLRREAVDLAIAAASKLVEKKLDTQEDRRIVTEFLANVDRGDVAATR